MAHFEERQSDAMLEMGHRLSPTTNGPKSRLAERGAVTSVQRYFFSSCPPNCLRWAD